jgi:hypothetical protein
MRIKPPKIEVPPTAPFRNDLLGREKCADALTHLITTVDDGLVLCLNASWGSGKSTFVSMWRQKLINDGFKTLMFNAWESDYVDDAMVALLGELELGVNELQHCDEGAKPIFSQENVDKLKKFGGKLFQKAIPLAVRLGTSGLVDYDPATEKILSDEAGKYAEEQIKAYEQAKKSIKAFRTTLEALAAEIAEAAEDDRRRPLVLFIDELDRCRPPFAIRILEIVKHFFSVPGIVFVLSLDREQLGHSIRSQYGEQMNVSGYLRRFFDVEFSLPVANRRKFIKAQFERFDLNHVFGLRQKFGAGDECSQIAQIFEQLFPVFGCSARDQERCFSLISLVLITSEMADDFKVFALALLVLLNVMKPNEYKRFVTRELGPRALLTETIASGEAGRSFLHTRLGIHVELTLRAVSVPWQQRASLTNELEKELSESPAGPRAKSLQDMIVSEKGGSANGVYGTLDLIDSRLNMVENFSEL